SVTATPKPGSPTCWRASTITRSPTWLRCCPGIGAIHSLSSALPDPGRTGSRATTIRRAAEILGEDQELLWDIATDMEPERGCLWIYDTDDQQIVVFTPDGMKYLPEMLPEYKCKPSFPRS